jgi:outer membrane protein OmpA-like peptidoglycan-associated protein
MQKTILIASSIGLLALGACTTIDPQTGERVPNRVATGAIIGAGIGAAAGAATNTSDGEQTRRNALIGAGIGAIAGAAVGDYMNDQEERLREQMRDRGVEVARTAENEVTLIMPDGITFAFGSADVRPQFRQTLQQVAETLRQYESTTVDVIGHTDSVGSDAFNLDLSQRRAESVASVLVGAGVQSARIVTVGEGERVPVATNETEQGRAANRRVEIKLRPVVA